MPACSLKRVGLVSTMLFFGGAAVAAACDDYPTEAKVDYVIGCMASNGQNPLVMRKCACSIDAIARHIPYEQYVEVETIKRIQEVPGERGAVFRDTAWMKDRLEQFRQAQVDADLQCF